MIALRRAIVAWLGVGALATGYVAASCNQDVVMPSAGSGGHGSSKTSGAITVVAGTGGMGGCTPTPPGEDGQWLVPTGDCYQPVAWADAGCAVKIARDPKLGAPPARWVPCSESFGKPMPGCDLAVRTWSKWGTHTEQVSAVTRTATGYRFAFNDAVGHSELGGPKDYPTDRFAVIYDENDTAIAGWLLPDYRVNGRTCDFWGPYFTADAVWMGAANYVTGQSQHALLPWQALASPGTSMPFNAMSQYMTARSSFLAAWLLDGATVMVVNTKKAEALFPSGAFGEPHVVGDYVIALAYPEYDHGSVGVYDAVNGKNALVVELVYPERVIDTNSDGKTLAWVTESDTYGAGWLWTSPFATSKAGIVPKKVRPTPAGIDPGDSAAGNGYYAVFSSASYGGDGKIHLYRLSDGREWLIDVGAEENIRDLLWLDESYLFWTSYYGVMRVRLDALGPGTPVP